MANSQIKTRIIHKHDTAANWELAVNFIPKQGEIIIYDKDSTYNYERFKIGDGATLVSALPFANDALKAEIQVLLNGKASVSSVTQLSNEVDKKVDKDGNKVLSTNDYTTDEKEKLAGVAIGATKVIVDNALSSTSTNAIQNKVVTNMKNEIDNALEEKLDINGNAVTATKATQDGAGQQINTTYIKGLSINGKTITYTKGDGTTGTITTQDTNTTYSAGTGLSLSGTTFNHSNSITAATAQGDASKTLAFNDTFTIPTITYDAQGHITGKGTTTMTMPVGPVAKEGNPVSEIGIAGAGFSAETIFEPKQEGSGDPSPDNIRPISGRTDATLTRCGVNIFPPGEEKTGTMNGITFVSDGNGKYTLNGTSTGSAAFVINLVKPVRIPDTYVGYFHMLNSVANGYFTFGFIENGTQTSFSSATIINRIRSIDEFGSLLRGRTIDAVQLYVNGSGRVFDNFTLAPMLLQTGTLTDYKPYTGDTYTADFGQTVYGGTLDWLTGVLTVDRAILTLTGNESLAFIERNMNGYNQFNINVSPGAEIIPRNAICSHYKRDIGAVQDAAYSCFVDYNQAMIVVRDAYSTANDFKAYLAAQYAAGTPVQIVYKLATPITIQLPPQDLRMLDGTNIVYSDGTTNYVIFNSGASSLGKAYELFFKKTDTIPVSNGGTGSTSKSGARTNLGITSGTSLPSSGSTGDIFFLY